MWRKNTLEVRKEEQDFWLRWLERYRTMKILWHEDFKHTAGYAGRYAAYEELAKMARTYYPDADVPFVRHRINAFRTNYRREVRRHAAARENGCDYEPQLFYYKILDGFLNDSPESFNEDLQFKEESQDWSNSSFDESNEIKSTNLKLQQKSSGKLLKSKKAEIYVPPTKIAKSNAFSVRENPSSADKSNLLDFDDTNSRRSTQKVVLKPRDADDVDDEYEILGKRIAAHFRSMPFNQRLIAEKIITDVCICGRMEKLSMDSTVFIESPSAAAQQKNNDHQEEFEYEEPEYIYDT